MAKYLRTILDQIGTSQEEANVILIDNTGAMMMTNARQPTRRTRHMDIKHFSIQDWVDQDLVIMERIKIDTSRRHIIKDTSSLHIVGHIRVIE